MSPGLRRLAPLIGLAAVLSCGAACSTPIAGTSSVGSIPSSGPVRASPATSAVAPIIPGSQIPFSQLTASPPATVSSASAVVGPTSTPTSPTSTTARPTAPAALSCPAPHLVPAPPSIRITTVECYDGNSWLVASGVYVTGGEVDGVEVVHQTAPGKLTLLGSGSDFSDSESTFRAQGMPADLIAHLVHGQPAAHETRTEK